MPGPIRDEWLPSPIDLQSWFDMMRNTLKRQPPFFNSVTADFEKFAVGNAVIYQQLNEMIDQASSPKPSDVEEMFKLLNLAISYAPAYNGELLVGRPFNAVIATCMQTPAGRAIFNDNEINVHIKKMFDVWVVCLTSKASQPVLNKIDGWLSLDSLDRLKIPVYNAEDPDNPIDKEYLKFEDAYACIPADDHYGFKSWDDFFVRPLKNDKVRPLPVPPGSGNTSLITCACESHLYRIAPNVNLDDKFWIKDHAYSLRQMLNDDIEFAKKFERGTVFQTYLSPRDYHRWHSPVKGTVKKIVQVPGTYYSVYSTITDDPAPNELSVGLLPHVATRVLIYIEPKDPKIGDLVCFIGVGMFEVSTCQVVVEEGNPVDNGQELGMFHFGGSSHCLIFQEKALIDFVERLKPLVGKEPDRKNWKRVMVNSSIANVL